jgi:hypothetical protein
MCRWGALLLALTMPQLATSMSAARERFARVVLFIRHEPSAVRSLFDEHSRRSDPKSDEYLRWMSREDVVNLLAPTPSHVAAATALAKAHGAQSTLLVGGDKLVATFLGPEMPPGLLAAAEATYAVEHVSATSSTRQPVFGRGPARVRSKPSASPRLQQPRVNATNATNPPGQACLAAMLGVTPTCLRTAYGLDDGGVGVSAAGGGGQAFVVNEPFAPSDLARFQSENALPDQPVVDGTRRKRAPPHPPLHPPSSNRRSRVSGRHASRRPVPLLRLAAALLPRCCRAAAALLPRCCLAAAALLPRPRRWPRCQTSKRISHQPAEMT